MEKLFKVGLVWFRRDLRAEDNAALSAALAQCEAVHCVFILDRAILDTLPRADRRVAFIRETLVELDADLRSLSTHPQGGLIVRHAFATDAIPALALALGAQAVFAAHDYEPDSIKRDTHVAQRLTPHGIAFVTHKDHVIFERQEILTGGGKPYSVFTPYRRAWLARLADAPPAAHLCKPYARALAPRPPAYATPVPSLESLGFAADALAGLPIATGASGAAQLLDNFLDRIDDYSATRNYPAVKGPSYLSVHLRFGTVSIRQMVHLAAQRSVHGSAGAEVWLSELIWREFYFQILANFPHVAQASFKAPYDAIVWESGALAQQLFAAWCQGRTGYPIIDAAMAQINQTGYMHNRLRMVAASFLVKHLGIDWRWGERYFAEKLIDFDLAANNGGWQWVSSSGCDAQPYFRIFNPSLQSEKFDPQGKFIRRYLPQLSKMATQHLHAPWKAKPADWLNAGIALDKNYPLPLVDHAQARQRTLERYAVVRQAASAATF